MYLAGILGLCALLHASAPGRASGVLFIAHAAQAPAPQTAAPQTSPAQTSEPAQAPPTQAAPGQAAPTPPAAQAKPAPAKKRPVHKKASAAPAQDPKKTVVRHGSTADSTAQLTPEINAAEADRQRQNTKNLLSSTDDNLQKLSTRLLTKDEQDTVAQIRVYMEQAKAADTKGDLERASKLAVKAHLLSEAITKQ